MTPYEARKHLNKNDLIDKTWDRSKFQKKQRLRKKYRWFYRLRNKIILSWLNYKDKQLTK